MESNSWVRNKQTVDVNFYSLSYNKLLYENSFCKQNRNVARRVYNSVVIKNKLNRRLYKKLQPFFIFYYLLFFHKCLNPFSHVTFSLDGVHHETREGKHFWRIDPIKLDKYTLKKTITIECTNVPPYDSVIDYTKNLRVHKGAHCPKALAYGIAYVFFPIRILGYPRETNDCVTVTSELLKMFGIETSKFAWTPKMLYDDLIKKEHV
tara:strand:+ start:19153 stop:19773 length:621 start_codon:yes stop_codon:yes gene_type:complete